MMRGRVGRWVWCGYCSICKGAGPRSATTLALSNPKWTHPRSNPPIMQLK